MANLRFPTDLPTKAVPVLNDILLIADSASGNVASNTTFSDILSILTGTSGYSGYSGRSGYS